MRHLPEQTIKPLTGMANILTKLIHNTRQQTHDPHLEFLVTSRRNRNAGLFLVDLEAAHGHRGRTHARVRPGQFVLSSHIEMWLSNQFVGHFQRHLVDATVRWSGFFGGN
jgi:hypothetical protein